MGYRVSRKGNDLRPDPRAAATRSMWEQSVQFMRWGLGGTRQEMNLKYTWRGTVSLRLHSGHIQ